MKISSLYGSYKHFLLMLLKSEQTFVNNRLVHQIGTTDWHDSQFARFCFTFSLV